MKKDLCALLCEEKAMRLKGGLYHQTQIKLAYNSNRIEGSRLSEEQTRFIFETNTIHAEGRQTANVDDIIETVNHFACFDYMLDHAREPLSEAVIKEYHRILKQGTSQARADWFRVGDYKAKANAVGDMPATPPARVATAMRKLLSDYLRKENSIDMAAVVAFHYEFERIHPFQDGNGRVGRMILFKECLNHNIMPFIIDNEHKQFYYRGLREFASEKGYLTDTCLSAQDAYGKSVSYFHPGIIENRDIDEHAPPNAGRDGEHGHGGDVATRLAAANKEYAEREARRIKEPEPGKHKATPER